MPAPANLTGARADKAARLFAEARAPFTTTDSLLIRGVMGYGVWWWDADRVRELLGGQWAYDRDSVIPEGALLADGDGWRQAAVREGFDAQYWENATLIASVWRRRPFTTEQWAAFARGVSDPAVAPPAEPPEPAQAPLVLRNASRIPRVSAGPGWGDAERAMYAVAALSLLGGVYFGGQALRFDILARSEQAAAAAAKASVKNDTKAGRARADLETLRALDAQARRAHPALAGAELFRILKPYNVTPTAWSVEGEALRVQIPLDGSVPVEEIASSIESNPWFANVAAQMEGQGAVATLTASVCQPSREGDCGRSAPPASSPGGVAR